MALPWIVLSRYVVLLHYFIVIVINVWYNRHRNYYDKGGWLLCWILTKSLNFIEEIKKRMSSKNMILQLTIHGWSINISGK